MPILNRWWLVIPVLLFAAWLGSRNLNLIPFWGDERNTVDDTGGVYGPPRTFEGIWQNLADTNPWHPPGYYLALNAWGRVVGWEPGALRALSFLAAMLAVALMYQLGRTLASPPVGLLAALLLASSILFVNYSIIARMYVPLVTLSLWTYWVYFRLLDQQARPSRLLYAGLALGTAGLLYTHYIGWIVLGTLGLYHLLFAAKNARWLRIALAVLLGVAAFLPWMTVLLNGVAAEADVAGERLNAVEVVARLLYLLGNGSGVLAAAVLLLALPMQDSGKKRLLFLALAALALLLVFNQIVPIVRYRRPRYLLELVPLFCLLMAAALVWLGRRGAKARVVAVLLTALLVGVGTFNALNRLMALEAQEITYVFPWHQVKRQVLPYAQADDLIVIYLPDDLTDRQEANIRDLVELEKDDFTGSYFVTDTELNPEKIERRQQERAEALAGRTRVWLAYLAARHPDSMDDFESTLAASLERCPPRPAVAGVRVDEWVQAGAACLGAPVP